DKLLSGLSFKLDSCLKRMDELESAAKKRDDAARKRDDDSQKRPDESQEEHEARMLASGKSPGQAKEPVADSDPTHRVAFAEAQQRCDECAQAWGARAPAPLFGEGLRSFRIRSLRPWQKFSKQFAKAD